MERVPDLDPEELEVLVKHLSQRIANAVTEIKDNLEILEAVDPEYAKRLRNNYLERLSDDRTDRRSSS